MLRLNLPTAFFFAAIFFLCALVAPTPSFAARSVSSTPELQSTEAPPEAAPEEAAVAPEEAVEEAAPRAIAPRAAAQPRAAAAPPAPRDRVRQAAPVASTESAPPAEAPAPRVASHNDYVLGSGDKLKVIVFGEPDLSGPFEVSSTGMVSMPLIGQVRGAGNTVSRLEQLITDKLKEGYMKDPRVSVEVMGYRPFFIVGEVMKPGSYDYVNGMTVITAVALAGGYTYRADKDGITLKHAGTSSKEAPAKEDAAVVPGDVIRVPERFF